MENPVSSTAFLKSIFGGSDVLPNTRNILSASFLYPALKYIIN